MLYLDLAMYIHSLSAETKIIIFQLSFLTFEIAYFFWLRKYFNEEEKKNQRILYIEQTKRNYYNTRVNRKNPWGVRKT